MTTRRRHRSRKHRTRSHKGGNLAGNPPSAWGWVMGTVGNGWTQTMNALTLQPGQNSGTSGSNDIVPVNNINAQDTNGMQKGGRRRRRRKGGNIAAVLNQAAAPGLILAAQQMYGKRRTRRHRR